MATDRVALAALQAEIVSCFRCPRLVAWREAVAVEKVKRFRDWLFDMAKTFPKPHALFDKRAGSARAPVKRAQP